MDTNRYKIVHYQSESISATTNLLSMNELAELSRVHPDMIYAMVEWTLLEPVESDPEPLFQETAVPRVWRIMRLRSDLGINWNGLGVVIDLLEKVDRLEREIARLKKTLGSSF